MKYRFLKLSVFCFTTHFFTVPVYADLVQLSNNDASTDRIEQLNRTLAQGSYAESNDIDLPSEPKSEITSKTNYSSQRQIIMASDGSFTDEPNLSETVEKKTYYPNTRNLHTYRREPKTWVVNCRKKNFDNKKICYMKAGDLWVFLINGKYSVNVGSNHYPRTKGGLRIDNGSAIYGYEGELPKALSIIERLKKGKVAYTRYQEWPYQYDTDEEVNLKDFTKQFNEMIKQYKNL